MKNKQLNHKVAVVGAGIIGVNCAYELQSLGFETTLFDPSGVGEQCSKGNAGHFATEQVFPLADPKLLPQLPSMLFNSQGPFSLSAAHLPKALPWFIKFLSNMLAKKRNENINALKLINKEAIKCYQQLLSSINAEHLLTCNGSLLVFEQTPQLEIEKIAAQYQKQGIALKILNKKECKQLEPELADTIKAAIYFTQVAHTINPHMLCMAIADAAFAKGSSLIKEKVVHISSNEEFATLKTDNSVHHFDKVVIATGAWSKPLLNKLGYTLPLEAEGGYHHQFTDQVALNRPVVSHERKFIITPMENGLRAAGTVEFTGIASKPKYQRAETLKCQAQYLLNTPLKKELNTSKTKQWHGLRPSLPDSLPVIGKAPKHENIYFSLGHQHLGLTLGAITGKLIGQLVNNEATDINLTPFCISRFN